MPIAAPTNRCFTYPVFVLSHAIVNFEVKKLPAVVLMLIMVVNTAGFYLYYPVALRGIRKEMKALLKTLPDEKLDFFILDNTAFQKARVEAHEIRLGGRMYDIARVEIKDGFHHVYCLHDKKEDNLISFLNHVLGKPFKSDTFPSVIQQFLSLVFILPSKTIIYEIDPVLTAFNSKPPSVYFQLYQDNLFIPPELFKQR